jgi:N-acetylmuramoyl-L-alanine amidase
MSKTNKLIYLVLHCTATPEGVEYTGSDVRRWHEQRWGKGKIGYRSLILLDGRVERLREANTNDIVEAEEVTWGVTGINRNAHHVCYVGGLSRTPSWITVRGKNVRVFNPKNTLTEAQKKSLLSICWFYINNMNPDILICGHNQFDNKACPSFDVRSFLRKNGIPEKNIYQPKPIGL